MTRDRSDSTGPGTVAILLTAVAVVLVSIGVSSTAWWASGRPVSEWPAWIEAGATLAAVGAAIIAGFYAARAFRLELDREQRWEEDRRAVQASRVVAWPLGMQPSSGPFNTETGQYPVTGVIGLNVRVRNASDLPVAKVRVAASIVVRRDDGFTDELDFGDTDFFTVEPETTTDVVVPAAHDEARGVAFAQLGDPDYETRVFPSSSTRPGGRGSAGCMTATSGMLAPFAIARLYCGPHSGSAGGVG